MSETRAVANGPLRTAWALHLHLASWQAGILGLEDMVGRKQIRYRLPTLMSFVTTIAVKKY